MTNTELLRGNKGVNITAVILDLDGTLLNTEVLGREALRKYLAGYGKVLIDDSEHRGVGRTLSESAVIIVHNYELPITPEQFIAEIDPLYKSFCEDVKSLPGANRLIRHLHKHKVPFALASNGVQESSLWKISFHEGWKESFCAVVGSDMVASGKPSPDIFLEAAKRMTVHPSNCLVIEDSLVGVKGAVAAGMKVVAIPIQDKADCSALADSVLHSLLDFHPELWGLPPFDDWVGKALPVDPFKLQGVLNEGFLDQSSEENDELNIIPDQACGVYFGWAEAGTVSNMKVVLGIGQEIPSTVWRKLQVLVLDGTTDHPSGQRVDILIVGFIRTFNSKGGMLVNTDINDDDISIAKASLESSPFVCPDRLKL